MPDNDFMEEFFIDSKQFEIHLKTTRDRNRPNKYPSFIFDATRVKSREQSCVGNNPPFRTCVKLTSEGDQNYNGTYHQMENGFPESKVTFKHESKKLYVVKNEYTGVWSFTSNPRGVSDQNCSYKQRIVPGFDHSSDIPSTKNMYWQYQGESHKRENGIISEKVKSWINCDLLRIYTDNENSKASFELKGSGNSMEPLNATINCVGTWNLHLSNTSIGHPIYKHASEELYMTYSSLEFEIILHI